MTIATKENTTMDDVAAALAVLGDYSVAAATTPPIATVLYKQRHHRIEKAWRAGESRPGGEQPLVRSSRLLRAPS